MPRLDNQDPQVIEEFELEVVPGDPGATKPVDVCEECYEADWEDEAETVEHPPYESGFYLCDQCRVPLHRRDN